MKMATHDAELVRRIDELEEQIKEEREAIQPLLNLYNASKIVGKIFVIIGGILTGGAMIFSTTADFFTRHWR
jgi:uncharacterized protein YjgD (DUF1641 family)